MTLMKQLSAYPPAHYGTNVPQLDVDGTLYSADLIRYQQKHYRALLESCFVSTKEIQEHERINKEQADLIALVSGLSFFRRIAFAFTGRLWGEQLRQKVG